ncbi:MAG: TIGR02281 family clan AA aspartic protease, partial [Leptolyngbyaceae cyanobacterium]
TVDTPVASDLPPSEDREARDSEINSTGGQVYSAPIVRRSGGTPVIQVLFNNEYTVEMIVDTGASGTVLTQRVAQALGVEPTGRTNVSTASEQNVSFLLGNVDSIQVDGAQRNNVVVAIAGPSLETGLLGNDFFGQYDVTVRSDVVEFQER